MCEKYCVKCTKTFGAISFFHGECVNLTIWQQQLHLFIKSSRFFRRTIVDICTCKGHFWNSCFLQRAALSECLWLELSLGVGLILKTATLRSIYLKYQVFVKTMHIFFQNTTCSRPFFKLVCHFIWREE